MGSGPNPDEDDVMPCRFCLYGSVTVDDPVCKECGVDNNDWPEWLKRFGP
jgi:hypothetical protein